VNIVKISNFKFLDSERWTHRPPTCGKKPSANDNIYAEESVLKKTPLLAVGFRVKAPVTRRPPHRPVR